jgi:hypothetical protein
MENTTLVLLELEFELERERERRRATERDALLTMLLPPREAPIAHVAVDPARRGRGAGKA